MTHLILDEVRTEPVLKADGARWAIHVTAPHEGWTLCSDHWIDAVRAILVDDYPAENPGSLAELDACFRARRRAALSTAHVVQGFLLAEPENASILKRLGPRTLRALTEPRDKPVAAVGIWRVPELPLTVVLSSYPVGAGVELPRSDGKSVVVVVDDLGDESLIRSFAAIYGWEIVAAR